MLLLILHHALHFFRFLEVRSGKVNAMARLARPFTEIVTSMHAARVHAYNTCVGHSVQYCCLYQGAQSPPAALQSYIRLCSLAGAAAAVHALHQGSQLLHTAAESFTLGHYDQDSVMSMMYTMTD